MFSFLSQPAFFCSYLSHLFKIASARYSTKIIICTYLRGPRLIFTNHQSLPQLSSLPAFFENFFEHLFFYLPVFKKNVETMMSRFLWSSLVLALVLMVDQTEGWRRRRRRRCPVRNCSVGPWTSWSTCTQPCGTGGSQRRTRRMTSAATCGGSCPALVETRNCNRGCSNGGTPVSGRCINCKTGYSGRCCTGGNILRQKKKLSIFPV